MALLFFLSSSETGFKEEKKDETKNNVRNVGNTYEAVVFAEML